MADTPEKFQQGDFVRRYDSPLTLGVFTGYADVEPLDPPERCVVVWECVNEKGEVYGTRGSNEPVEEIYKVVI